MFGNHLWSSPKRLAPQKELEIVKFYLEKARKTDDPILTLAVCDDVEAQLSRMKKAAKNVTTTPLSAAGQTFRDGIVDAYLELGKLMENLGYGERARNCYKKAEKLGYCLTEIQGLAVSSATDDEGSDIARILDNIFTKDKPQPTVKCSLPAADEQIRTTSQLVYSLGLLKMAQLPDEALDPTAVNWVNVTQKNAEEKQRLRALATDLIRAFASDELKDARAVAEVASLASVLDKSEFDRLLELFVDGVNISSLLDVNSLEGLAQLLRQAPSDYLNADDLVRILDNLNNRLQDTHSQSSDQVYHLTFAVSNVLDAMADTKVSGLKRVELHEPLSAYLDGLRSSNDPYLVYQAAYAFQALLCVPDNESPLQATMRRAEVVMKGVSGLVSAAKGLDINGFIEGLGHLQDGVAEVIQVVKIGYEGASALLESGQGLLKSLEVGFSFDRKRAWYATLRVTDTLLKHGYLAQFKTVVCKAPCRRDVAFQLGVCQRLGNIAANTQWDVESRQGAVAFLGDIYRNDEIWGQQALVKQRSLQILMQLALAFGFDLPGVESLLKELESNGNDAKQALYQDCRKQGRSSYPSRVGQEAASSPSLLDRVQNKPDVEADLRRLKRHRLKDRGSGVYIPPQAKPNLQAHDDTLFPLMEKVQEFLSSNQKVMLLLGDSGAGKSTFNRKLECDMWNLRTTKKDRIPLYINLPAIDKPEQDLIAKHLRRHNFTEPQIRELRVHREFVLICDGYDESQQMHNLYMSNQLNQGEQWRAQMVISCRSEYLPSDYRDRFQPMHQHRRTSLDLFQQAVVAPFSPAQIKKYVTQYVSISRPLWQTKDYLDALENIPDLMELVKNPFLLTLSLEVLPRMMDIGQDVSKARVTRVALYDQFVEQWLERGKKRLGEKVDLSESAKRAFERLTDEGFTQNGISFVRDLAGAIYKYQGGNPVVDYSHKRDSKMWKGAFFNRDDENQLLLEACPMVRNGSQHRFVHRSLLEYCFTRVVFEPQEAKKIVKIVKQTELQSRRRSISSMFSFEDRAAPEEEPVDIDQPLGNHPLTWRSLAGESSILQFLADRAQEQPLFKKQLLRLIERSKTEKEARKAAANAITILVRARIPFLGADLKCIQIPGADLSGGQFDSAQLQGADLRKANLRNIWLRQANLSNAKMAGVQFGECPFLTEDSRVNSCTYSPDGTTYAVGLESGTISVYNTSTWANPHTLRGHTDQVFRVIYSPSGQQIASGSHDKTVRLWDAQTGALGPILSGHSDWVRSVVYSPSGQQIASGSNDETVRLWDAQTGAPGPILSGHTGRFSTVVYSPSGQQIALGSHGETVRLWDAQTGAPGPILSGHTGQVYAVVFSPSGQQIASGGEDKTVRLWDAQTGAPGPILSGHTRRIFSVVYSPSGQQIASGSDDKTVRLWDARTGAIGPILSGHTESVTTVVYSPNGQQIASGSDDETVRLWDAQTGAPGPILNGHTHSVCSVVYSPSGQQIASGSRDKTVRLWEAQTSAPDPISSGHTESVCSVVYSPSGQYIASGSWDKTVRLWDVQSGAPGPILSGHTDRVWSVVYSPSGQQIASRSGDKTVRLWDAQTGAPGPILSGHTEFVSIVVYSPSGQQIASGSHDETVRLWDAQIGAPGPILSGHTGFVWSMVYSPSGQQIASGSTDTTVRLWDTQTGAPGPILSGHNDWVRSLVYSPNGQQIASGSDDTTVRLWDAQTGASGPILSGHTDAVSTLAYSSNGQQIATGSWDKTVRLWDTHIGAPGPILNGHTNGINVVVYSPSGQQIASGSEDKTVRLWDVNSYECLAIVQDFHGSVTTIAWNATPNGTYFATGCDDKSVRMWQVVEEEDRYQVRLHWSTIHEQLALSKSSIQDVQGLSEIDIRLLEQRGAVSKPTSP